MRNAVLVALGCAALAVAQQPTIRTDVPLVLASASVLDEKGRPISGLTASDFVLLDDGKPRRVALDTVDSGLPPISLVTLVQTTATSLSALAKIRKVGSMISEAVVGENGEAAVLSYGDGVARLTDFTRDASTISDAFKKLEAQDSMGGPMIDAVGEALKMLAAAAGPRRAYILVIGESRDRGSTGTLSDLLPKVQSSGATVYCLSYSAYFTPFTTRASEYQPTGGSLAPVEFARLFKQNTAAALANISGGRRFGFETKGKLEQDLMAVSGDIHSRYVLSFTPETGAERRFHALTLRIPKYPKAAIRCRTGYWSNGK